MFNLGLARPVGAFWSIGCAGQSREKRRQIRLVNQLMMLGFSLTLPYQVFFLLYDSSRLLSILLVNLIFMCAYVVGIWLNSVARYELARFVGVATTLTHLFVISFAMSAHIGAHLFYIPMAGMMVLLYSNRDFSHLLAQLGIPLLLCLICQFFFLHGISPVSLPEQVENLLYAMSIGLCVMVSGFVSYFYRSDTEHAEKEQDRIQAELLRLGGVDQLTQIANRRRLDEYLSIEWGRMRRQGRSLSVLMIDIDLFKNYNDLYGHQAGDDSLRDVASALNNIALRPGDLVARYGGEEFMIILPDTDDAGARRVGEQAREAVYKSAITHADSDVASVLTISVGTASMIPTAKAHQDELVKQADQALYLAKKAGRNCVKSACELMQAKEP